MTLQTRIDRLKAGTASIGFLVNPMGGQAKKHKAAIRQILNTMPNAIVCTATDAFTFKSSVDSFIIRDVDLLVIVAGDGTTQAVLSLLFAALPLAQWPVLMIVPGGTTNMTSLDLGIRGNPEQVLRQLRSCLFNPPALRLVQCPALCIEQTGTTPIYGMFFAIGLVARGVKFSRSSVKQLGITGGFFTALIMLRSLIGMLVGMMLGRPHSNWAPVTLSITEASGRSYQGTYLFALVSALDCLLLNMRPYWGQESAPLHVTLVDRNRKRLWRSLWPLLSGNGHILKEEDGYHSYNTQALTLLMDDEYIVDGELHRSANAQEPLRITATNPITFLVL